MKPTLLFSFFLPSLFLPSLFLPSLPVPAPGGGLWHLGKARSVLPASIAQSQLGNPLGQALHILCIFLPFAALPPRPRSAGSARSQSPGAPEQKDPGGSSLLPGSLTAC